jgi:hypothetical protein
MTFLYPCAGPSDAPHVAATFGQSWAISLTMLSACHPQSPEDLAPFSWDALIQEDPRLAAKVILKAFEYG